MCGIAGFIGQAKKPKLTYQLITSLFSKIETRGEDASGYWGTEQGVDGAVLYHKEPLKSSKFVQNEMWRDILNYNPSLMLVHARGASKGVGLPSVNKNNHPFTNFNKSLGLIHNGRISDSEYLSLKQKYRVLSDCDSEILLRIFESCEIYYPRWDSENLVNVDYPHRLAGCKNIFSFINQGHMAVAVGERGDNGDRMLWLFRNEHRPLWVVDVRESLGQVFFVSEPSIWEDVINESSDLKTATKNYKFVELPTEEVWFFKTSIETPYPKSVQRFKVKKLGFHDWNFDGETHNSNLQEKKLFDIVTNLDEDDNLIVQNEVSLIDLWENSPEESVENSLNEKFDQLVNLIDQIRFGAEELISEGLLSKQDLYEFNVQLDRKYESLNELNRILSQ